MILSRKEYEEKAKLEEVLPQDQGEEEILPPEPTVNIIHFLMYPENEKGNPHNGIYRIDINGEIETLAISNGVVRTNNSKIKDRLIKDGFLFMYSK